MSRVTKKSRPLGELQNLLTEQIQALRSSAGSYDSGNIWEAPRIAVTISMLLHDGSAQQGLLRILNHRSNMRFLDTSRFAEIVKQSKVDVIFAQPLVSISTLGDAKAIFSTGSFSPMNYIKFGQWWEAPILMGRKSNISRKNLIQSMRNFDGGAHIDADVPDDTYTELANEGDGRVGFEDGSFYLSLNGSRPDGVPIRNLNRATVRQICWELDESLKAYGF